MITLGKIRKAVLLGSIRAITYVLGYKQPQIVPPEDHDNTRGGDTDMYEFGHSKLGFESEGVSDSAHDSIQRALNKVGAGISELMDQEDGPAQMIALDMIIAIYCSIYAPMIRHDEDLEALLKKTRVGLEGARKSFQESIPVVVDEDGKFSQKKSSTFH